MMKIKSAGSSRFAAIAAALIAFALAACGDSTDTSDLEYFGSSAVVGSSLTTTVLVRNADTQPVTISTGGCTMDIRVFTDPQLNGPIVFATSNRNGPCTAQATSKTLQPNDSTNVSLSVSVSDVLGTTNPAGLYYIAAVVAVRGVVTVPAGSVNLTR